MSIHPSSFVTPGDDVVHCDLDGGAVLLDLRTRRYFKLNRVSAHVWSRLGDRAEVGALRRSILETFDVDPERCTRDLDALLEAMSAAGLIEIGAESGHVPVA
nr:PqqD family protein [Sphingomonas sp. Y57]